MTHRRSWVRPRVTFSTPGSSLFPCPTHYRASSVTRTHTHTHPFNGPFLGLPRSAGTRKVKPIWILLEQETVSGSGISWAICKSAPRSRQITTPAHHYSVFYRPDALPTAQPTASKHWRPKHICYTKQDSNKMAVANTEKQSAKPKSERTHKFKNCPGVYARHCTQLLLHSTA